MGKYFITGRQGSGKTTVIKLLQERGFAAYNTDDLPETTKLQNKETGEIVQRPDGKVDWSTYSWNWQRAEIERLLSSNETVFLGAIVSNQTDFYPLFDKVFVLTLDSDTLRKRLETHEHSSHHLSGEIERILFDHDLKQERLVKNGESILASRSSEEVVEDILKRVSKS